MIAITFALPAESSAFLRLLQNRSDQKQTGIQTVSGTLHRHAVTVIHTGVGEKATRMRLGQFLEATRPVTLISGGFAGAVRESLVVGDILLAENRSAPSMLQIAGRALAGAQTQVGTLATAHAVIESVGMRQQIAQETGAAAVDMETEFIAELCANSAIPMISLRVITDTPRAPFPAPARILFNLERQRTEFAPLFWHLLTHPAAMPALISFAGAISKCRARLTTALDLLLRETLH